MARLRKKADGERLVLPGRIATEVVGAGSGARGVTVRLVEVQPPGPGEVERGPHVHHGFEECIHVLSGRGVTHAGGRAHPLEPGDTLLVPPGERHKTMCTGSEPLMLVCFFPVPDIRPGTEGLPPSTPA